VVIWQAESWANDLDFSGAAARGSPRGWSSCWPGWARPPNRKTNSLLRSLVIRPPQEQIADLEHVDPDRWADRRELGLRFGCVEVIDPRTLELFDMDTVLESVEKTNRLVIVDEDRERCNFAAELGFKIQEQAFDSLDAPIQRVSTRNFPIAGGTMEPHILPQREEIKAAIEQVMVGSGVV